MIPNPLIAVKEKLKVYRGEYCTKWCKLASEIILALAFVIACKTNTMPNTSKKYIYTFNFDETERALCALETQCLFAEELLKKHLYTDVKVNPSHSAFIKSRLGIMFSATTYQALLLHINNHKIQAEGFKVAYVVFKDDETPYNERLEKLREIGYSIEGIPEYMNPIITYGIGFCDGNWYFGELLKANIDWHKHQKKPHSFSNSIGVNIAKTLVNIAAKNNKNASLLDACCGMGTIMLEACFAGNKIEGCEINEKTFRRAKANLAHFQYTATIHHADVCDLNKKYDAAIIDLPYNLFTLASNEEVVHIIQHTALLTHRLVIVSIADMEEIISQVGFQVTASCTVRKKGKSKFARRIWVCEKNQTPQAD